MSRRLVPVMLPLLFLLALPSGVRGDDVPYVAQKECQEARTLLAKGDAKSLSAAFSLLSKVKDKALDSVDFWETYVRAWRALKKPEEALWKNVIGKREKEVPTSPVFDVLRARLEDDPVKKRAHLEAAVAKDAKVLEPRVLLARLSRTEGKDDEAEALLDKILVDFPACEPALVMKGEMMIESGLSRQARDFAKQQLATNDLPGLHHLLATALRKLAEDDIEVRKQALSEAEKAVAGRPDPEYVVLEAQLLEESGRAIAAVALLQSHFEKTGSPLLAALLGVFAFRMGDYDGSVKSLAMSGGDVPSLKALALAHARRGRAKEARAALDLLLAKDPGAVLFAARAEAVLGDVAAVRSRIAGKAPDGPESDDVLSVLTWCDAQEGKAADIVKRVGDVAKDGSAVGEEWLATILQARVMARLGTDAPAARKRLLEARWKAAGEKVPEAVPPKSQPPGTAVSHGMMMRLVTYFDSVCGTKFQPRGFIPWVGSVGGKMHVALGVLGSAVCAREPERIFGFNPQLMEGTSITLNQEDHDDIWEAAQAAFKEGCAALVAEDCAGAVAGFTKALEKEPTWSRATLFRAAAKALAAGGDVAAAAKEADAALSWTQDDMEGRTLAILLALLAKADPAKMIEEHARWIEARTKRRPSEL